MKKLFILAATVGIFGCSTLVLQPADFSWPVESILTSDAKGIVSESRFAVSFSIADLMAAEHGENAAAAGKTVRVIRDRKGFYFVTAPTFKNVYVFTTGDGELKQFRKIEIGETEMSDPKFNQRDSYIELLNGSSVMMLTKDGISEGDKK